MKYVGCHVRCDSKSKSTNWSCFANVEIEMISHENAKLASMTLDRLFNSVDSEWGWKQFIEWNKVIDPKFGFLKNNTVINEYRFFL